jgi:succinate dehydrogenase/fumarate reductase-like Fe-S protein
LERRHSVEGGIGVTRVAQLRVWRGSAADAGRYQTYDVPFEEGMSVLDALRWVRTHRDPTLAIRYSCLNANACKTCMALVDGNVEYTCTARLTSAGATVAPLPSRPVVRDLVTDTAPADERL